MLSFYLLNRTLSAHAKVFFFSSNFKIVKQSHNFKKPTFMAVWQVYQFHSKFAVPLPLPTHPKQHSTISNSHGRTNYTTNYDLKYVP